MERLRRRITPTELRSYSRDIRVILHTEANKSYYIKPLGQRDMTEGSFVFLDNQKYLRMEVDYRKLTVVADVAMCHKFFDDGTFHPTYEEVIRQIPDCYEHKVCAFEIMYGPWDDDDIDAFAEEVSEGYHVFIVRLYGKKREGDEPATEPFKYPKGAPVPVNMEEYEFDFIRKNRFVQWYL